MKDIRRILEPKQSTVNKILLYSKSIRILNSDVLKDKILVHTN